MLMAIIFGLVGIIVGYSAKRWRAEPSSSPVVPAPQTPPAQTPPALKAEPETLAQAVIAALADAALVIDEANLIYFSNAKMQAIIGPLPIGSAAELYLRQPAALDALNEAARHQRSVERELLLLTPIERVFTVTVTPFRTNHRFMLVTLRDMTRERLTDRMRVDFVANASHELRTPLAAVIGFLETLQSGAIDDVKARDRFLSIMSSEANRMVRLIDDLLSLSRIEMDKFVRPITPLALAPVIDDVHNSLLMRLNSANHRLVCQIDDHLANILADRDQIIQVLHNLLGNAIKYSRQGSTITLRARMADRDSVELIVKDEGDGIPPEHIPRLTERFYRVDTARSRQMGGTGLGLAIVKHIVERHRGQLRIESQIGVGTSVIIRLPIASAESVAAATQKQ